MITFLRKLFGGGPLRSEKEIYRYWDGRQWQNADPIRIQLKLVEIGGDNWTDMLQGLRALQASKLPLTPAMQAQRLKQGLLALADVAELARKVFGVQPYGMEKGKAVGLTEAECLGLITDFLDWVDHLVEDVRPFASWPAATELAFLDSPDDSTIAPSADSTSDAASSETGGATPSPKDSLQSSEVS
ncbi:hypothetical protein [Tuwongella immobilis]|uniref:Uncharacterized protein n=1 Tax=Tuwongella immobilis TaxID=692036 RepID=A0A6C2YXX2_9BACT|nr:hypothetical protein [Tuwongella immobilis]VIP05605.1 unnamed protein product [Tuwongella immobilis]VTS08565.1 unnamed protein product [Tuwongella immobilis]